MKYKYKYEFDKKNIKKLLNDKHSKHTASANSNTGTATSSSNARRENKQDHYCTQMHNKINTNAQTYNVSGNTNADT